MIFRKDPSGQLTEARFAFKIGTLIKDGGYRVRFRISPVQPVGTEGIVHASGGGCGSGGCGSGGCST